MSTEPEFLTPAKIHRISGFARAAQQAEWLKLNGIPHKAFERRVVVSRVHVRAWLEGRADACFAPDLKSAAFLNKGRTGSIPVPGTIE